MKSGHLGVWACLLLGALTLEVSAADEATQVAVSILPQKYFAERIAGEKAKVLVIVPQGANPATYEPKPSQMRKLADSRVYFAIGVPFEKAWLGKMTAVNPGMEVVYTDRVVTKSIMPSHHHNGAKDHLTHSKIRGAGSPEATALDPHIWLSPPLVKIQARTIADAIIKTDPDDREFYENNLRQFQADLDRLDDQIREIFKDTGHGKEFFVFHPSWGYFAEAYGLNQIPLEVEGKEPSATEMTEWVKYATAKGIKVIFVQPQFPKKGAEAIAREIGGRIAIADPLREDWITNLLEMAEKVKAALR
ncbi:MAG: zinc ABC transporter substrate-binding protein [Thermodesulfobacteriota bacterium]|nr:zinc ABC transporter substrate-binding protein [Thermodesulfobacteriota bacterium]